MEPLEVETNEAEPPEANIHNNKYIPIPDRCATLAAYNNQYAPLA